MPQVHLNEKTAFNGCYAINRVKNRLCWHCQQSLKKHHVLSTSWTLCDIISGIFSQNHMG
ncbi:hypothetical protein Xmau_03563 [Xenorhabdus mauleonii]|uniref:Uncharacterized protein n=1 Tax=Xenorhabdus mauleonii TaxID=351675 RepID=A0A1I3X1U6_9GAMM|nr:hypothetical protein Xmau_03563 [Xenorhabdus mauleonii]SFK13259.1 hypothetical protein SAMN05421680_13112 [Xenorhabdus mauleonii]